jgi:hypothetical protein
MSGYNANPNATESKIFNKWTRILLKILQELIMSKGIQLPREIGDKLSREIGLAPGGLKRIEVTVDPETGELSLKNIIQALTDKSANIKVIKHFDFGSLEAFAEVLLKSYQPNSDFGAFHPPLHIVLIQAVALECFLNDMFIHHARVEYGEDSKYLGPAFISGSFRSKLYRLIPTISKGEKILDQRSTIVKNLEKLITIRNRIAHTAEYYTDYSEDKPSKRSSQKPFIQTINKKQCEVFQKTLQTFTCGVWNAPPWSGEFFKDPTPESDDE